MTFIDGQKLTSKGLHHYYSERIMEKSLSERIASRECKKTTGSKNKVLFLAQRKDITEALENGWSITIIWKTLCAEGKIAVTYNTFRLYVSRFIEGNRLAYTKKMTPNGCADNNPSTIKPMRSFIFNPKPNPDDLF